MKNKQTVLIIGGTSGIGASAVIRFSHDHEVIFIGRNKIMGKKVAKLYNALFIKCDISKKDECTSLVKDLQKYNITKVVHCAGIYSTKTSAEYCKKYSEVKLNGVKIILSLLAQKPITHICAISSLYTFLPEPFAPAFEKSINKKLEEEIISLKDIAFANCVAPGLTNTPLARKAYGKKGFINILDHAPGSRILQPIEIAESIHWLSTQNIITGLVIPIDGGYIQSYFENNNVHQPRK